MEENKHELYSNALTVSNTFFDFTLTFKKENIYESEEGQRKEVEDVSSVRMSPQLAKALSALLQDNVKQYEEKFGEIPAFKAE